MSLGKHWTVDNQPLPTQLKAQALQPQTVDITVFARPFFIPRSPIPIPKKNLKRYKYRMTTHILYYGLQPLSRQKKYT
jgi:hypothetical protein